MPRASAVLRLGACVAKLGGEVSAIARGFLRLPPPIAAIAFLLHAAWRVDFFWEVAQAILSRGCGSGSGGFWGAKQKNSTRRRVSFLKKYLARQPEGRS